MLKNKKKKKTFKTNQEYFDWFNNNKEKIKIVEFKITNEIKLSYKERVEKND